MIYFFRLENTNGSRVSLLLAGFDDLFLFLGAGKQNVIRLGILVGHAKIVRPREAKFLQDFVEQFLPSERFVVFCASEVTLFVKLFAESPNRFSFGIRRPPRILLKTCLEVVVRK